MNKAKSTIRALLCSVGLCALLMLGIEPAAAQTLYAASGSNAVQGQLFTLNPANGAVLTTVGPLNNATGAPFGMTGMAFHPINGTLYGSTANISPTLPRNLVTINPLTGLVTVIGAFGAGIIGTLSDITFAADGTMYGWESAGQHRLCSVNLATGVATPIGVGLGSGLFGGGGLAARWPDNTLFSTPDGATGPRTLRTVDGVTGVSTTVAPLSNLPAGFTSGSVDAMDFNNAGVLFGLLNNRGSPSLVHLVQINQTTAAITDLGPTNNDLDALAFQRVIPEPAGLTGIGLGAVALLIRRRTR